MKAKRFQNTLDLHYDHRVWGRNDFANLDNAVYLPQKNALFAPLLDISSFTVSPDCAYIFNEVPASDSTSEWARNPD